MIQKFSAPELVLGWLLFSFFLPLVLSTLALGLLGSAIMPVPNYLDELLRELILLSGGRSDPGEELGSDCVSESIGVMAVDTSASGTPPENFSILCSPGASCSGGYPLSLSCLSLCPSSSSASSSPPPSSPAEALGTCGELTTGYYSDAESSAFGEDYEDDASGASSDYGEILRDLYYDCAAAARWNWEASFSLLTNWKATRLRPIEESVAESNASDVSSEYELVSPDLYFSGYEAFAGGFEDMPGEESGAFKDPGW
ncbi:hypothetical protein L873DRAFT_1794927 [Choiromyces venosus 120613-1]|uniref:Uncharacterized protein n=1 Tax=Choiromyces venosus 120613-1 TaxID=1336337 RepID=A0A3N4J2J1_9PEZI|nr:hypothetical protein L873DRAFT_1794927 [Choiromyces venosus 120613-1]